MSVLSKALRFAVLVSVFGGCATSSAPQWTSPDRAANPGDGSDTVATTESDTQINDSVSGLAAEQPTDTAATAAPTGSQELLGVNDAGVGVELERGTGYTKVLVSSPNENPYEVTSMDSPPRLVLDLIGSQSNGNRAVPVESDSFVQGIRVGSHTDRTRIVFDLTQLAGSTDSTYRTVDRENGKVAITFRSVGTEAAAAPIATEAATITQAANTTDSVVAELPAPQELASNEVVAPVAVAPVAAPAKAEQIAQATVEQIRFSKTKNSAGEVAVAVNGKAPFELRHNAPSEYSLVISGATATEDAKFPQLAAPGAEGIRSTRTVQSGSDVIVRMFVDSGVELRAFSRNSEILVVANAANSGVASEARGQMKPEEEKPAESDANVEVAGGDETARRNPTGIASADGSKIYTGRLISLDLQETDIDNALRIIAEVSNLNIIASDDVTGKVTLRLVDVPWDQALDVILKTNGLDQVTEGNVIRIAPVDKLRQEREALREAKKAAENLEDLKVTYTRISYARATELKEQVEAVLTERGSVAVDERTN
ncbi:MAG: secretin and TonB N-terminal domain-containing protein, partial [Deltaproteobacteria bacterium]|nr:secretin and TonB N-terminal domain-containing protein [Deltaproteobacteria bacterium]